MPMIHETAEVSPEAEVGEGTRVWHQAQIRERARIGANCVIGKGGYVDRDVVIGDNVKIQNHAMVYRGATLADGVFVGPMACLANDLRPRAITPEGRLKEDEDWVIGETHVDTGASVGAAAVVLPGVRIGAFAMVGAGAVVTGNVPAYGKALGVPARQAGWVCRCGRSLEEGTADSWACPSCRRSYRIAAGLMSLTSEG
jgi:acetyltransferase-like isoleucine patch superfamily enzyme